MRRVVVWVLVWSILLSFATSVGAVAVPCTSAPSVAAGYAACIQVVHGGRTLTYSMNVKIYRERGIVVYGGPTVLGEIGNTFVGRTKPNPGQAQTVAGGYYVRDGVHGEYRYHGYDAAGNKYENAWFPDDVVVNPPEARTWVYRPWTNPGGVMSGVRNAPTTPGLYATASEVANRTIAAGAQTAYGKLAAGLGWFPQARYPTGATSGTTIADYAYVHQKASTRVSGAASMWSVGRKTGKSWVQTFEIPKLVAGDKRMVPVTATMTVKSKDREAQPFDFSKAQEAGVKVLAVDVVATLGDAAYDADEKMRDLYLTRRDLLFGTAAWKIQLFNNVNQSLGVLQVANQGYRNPSTGLVEARAVGHFNIRVTAAQLTNLTYPLRAAATAQFVTGETSVGNVAQSPTFLGQAAPPVIPPLAPSIAPNIPSSGFDVVPFPASDATVLSGVIQRTVTVDGVATNAATFFQGKYVFGVGKHGQHVVEVSYLYMNGAMLVARKVITIYDTKPYACLSVAGELKAGRTVTVLSCASSDNLPQVLSAYPIQTYTYGLDTVDGQLSSVTTLSSTPTQKQYRFQQAGTYVVTLQVANKLGRVSDVVQVAFEIQPDFAPALIQHAYNNQVVRGAPVTFFSDASSVDGDALLPMQHTVWWDSDGDGVADRQVAQVTGPLTRYVPTELGDYEVRSSVQETTGQKTNWTTAFQVENEAPTTDVFIDQPEQRTKADVFVMFDASLPREEVQAFSQRLVTIQNTLSQSKIDAEVRKWDGYPYVYQQPLSTRRVSINHPPDSAITYSAGGYTGQLPLVQTNTSVIREDQGSLQTMTDRRLQSDSCDNLVHYYYDAAGNQTAHSSYSLCPQSITYDDGTFSGILARTGQFTNDPACPIHKTNDQECTQLVTAQYAGEVTHVHVEWVANWVVVMQYEGVYQGTGYREVTEPIPVDEPFHRVDATPYLIYVTADRINQPSALQQMADRTQVPITVFSPHTVEWTTRPTTHVSSGLTSSEWESTLQLLLEPTAAKEDAVVLVDEPVEIHRTDDDAEGDAIVQPKEMLIQDLTTIDQPEGLEEGAISTTDPMSWQAPLLQTSFHKPGTYTLRRQVADQPISACTSCDFSAASNIAEQQFFVHRRPVALAHVNTTWDAQGGMYMIQPIDESYDPDNALRRADKGIVRHRVLYTKSGSTEVRYGWPSQLQSGMYSIEYAVEDTNGAWSTPLTLSLQLDPKGGVQMQLDAQVKRTEAWQAFHTKKRVDGVGPLQIYAGEKLRVSVVLGSGSNQVRAIADWSTKSGNVIHTEVPLVDTGDGIHFEAVLHNMDWMRVSDPIALGRVSVRIVATNANGTSTQVDVPLQIIGSIYETYGVQRLK
jgi:hypothetical protein